MSKINAIITGVGGYVPDFVLSNEVLVELFCKAHPQLEQNFASELIFAPH